MHLALSLLCENPVRKTGLTSLFVEMVSRSLQQFPKLSWVVYVAPEHDWSLTHDRLITIRKYSGSNKLKKRLFADHFLLALDAKKRGVEALVTIGFTPIITAGLPVAMHMLSLQHLSSDNNVGILRGTYRKWAASNGLKKANLIITNTEFAISQILEVNPEVEKKIVQSYEGLQHEFYVPEAPAGEVELLKNKFNIKPGYLYWCSNFYPYKQAEKFFEAYALLSEEDKKSLPIVMVGGSGWGDGFENAMARAKKLEIDHYITKLGWVDDDDLAMLYRQSKFFVLASREETFGRCVIESMACGRPCVVNNIPVMHEVTNKHASIVNFDAPEQVVTEFQRLIHDTEYYTQLSASGIARSKRFNFDTLAQERVEAIKQII